MMTTEQILALENKLYKADDEIYFVEKISINNSYSEVFFDVSFIDTSSLKRIRGVWERSWFEMYEENFLE